MLTNMKGELQPRSVARFLAKRLKPGEPQPAQDALLANATRLLAWADAQPGTKAAKQVKPRTKATAQRWRMLRGAMQRAVKASKGDSDSDGNGGDAADGTHSVGSASVRRHTGFGLLAKIVLPRHSRVAVSCTAASTAVAAPW